MADYWKYESNFEVGSFAEWTSETDTNAKFTVRHFADIVEKFGLYPAALPYRGAYCAHMDLALGTADAYVQEDTGFDTDLDNPICLRFAFQATGNLVMAASDYFTIFTAQSAGPVDEAVIGIVNDAGVLKLVAAETSALAAGLGAATRSTPLILNEWHLLELVCDLDAGGGNDGTVQFWVDGYQVGTTITTLDQAALVQARLGAIGIDAGTTAGHLFFDTVTVHTAQLGNLSRGGRQVVLTKTGWAALGPGVLVDVALVPGGATDNHLVLYDTDTLPVYAGADILAPELTNFALYTMEHTKLKRYFNRGVYAVLTGTAPRAQLVFDDINLSTAQIRRYAQTRRSL